MRGRPGCRCRRARATGLSPVGPPRTGAEAASPWGWCVPRCATTALAGAVPWSCVRGARSRFGGVGTGAWCRVFPVSPFQPRVSCAVCGGPSRPGVPYPRSLVRGCRQDWERKNSSKSTCSGGRCKDQQKGTYNAFGLRGLAFPLTSRYSLSLIPPYIGLGRRECDEPGFMPLLLYTSLATPMRKTDRSDNIMIFNRDVHMAEKVAALDDPPQVCSMQLTKSRRSAWARSYDH